MRAVNCKDSAYSYYATVDGPTGVRNGRGLSLTGTYRAAIESEDEEEEEEEDDDYVAYVDDVDDGEDWSCALLVQWLAANRGKRVKDLLRTQLDQYLEIADTQLWELTPPRARAVGLYAFHLLVAPVSLRQRCSHHTGRRSSARSQQHHRQVHQYARQSLDRCGVDAWPASHRLCPGLDGTTREQQRKRAYPYGDVCSTVSRFCENLIDAQPNTAQLELVSLNTVQTSPATTHDITSSR